MNDITLFGTVFGTESQATAAVNSIKSRISQITSKIKPAATKPTKQPAPTLADLKAFPGMDTVTAVKNGNVLIQPFSYSSQALTAVDGLERLARTFGLN